MLVQSLKSLQGTMSQKAFAAKLGIRQSTLSRIYAGKRKMGIDVITKVISVYPEFAMAVGASFAPRNIAKEIEPSTNAIEAA
ncbi:MAG: helix-turn-helix domain-containing protein [Chloroflexota bacterium]